MKISLTSNGSELTIKTVIGHEDIALAELSGVSMGSSIGRGIDSAIDKIADRIKAGIGQEKYEEEVKEARKHHNMEIKRLVGL